VVAVFVVVVVVVVVVEIVVEVVVPVTGGCVVPFLHKHDWTCSMEIPCSTARTTHTLSPLVKQSHEWSPPFHVKYVQFSPSSRTPLVQSC